MKFVKQHSSDHGLKNIDWGMYYIGKDPVRVILGPCLSIICSSERHQLIGISHIYPSPFDDDRYGPYNHPENVVSAYLRHLRAIGANDAKFWVLDRERTTIRGKELIMRSIDALIQQQLQPILLNGFPAKCALTTQPQLMQVEVYDIASHETRIS
ncbi:hypothetical protein SAMN02745165_00917 [Malonomonas rubra DSM 5091]|uniref:Uncharacterized protein n=1 Tax=Malonomonas rubra DSM 5091 TaxID=1122189 RepID=A0A1M6E3C2_MALRU|nr:hypothetical protein [Malonomonas rubra]SHI79880.1 hypothetical protein SAMN02745165_00917 [Malonomonas rubra DSM 5091]